MIICKMRRTKFMELLICIMKSNMEKVGSVSDPSQTNNKKPLELKKTRIVFRLSILNDYTINTYQQYYQCLKVTVIFFTKSSSLNSVTEDEDIKIKYIN